MSGVLLPRLRDPLVRRWIFFSRPMAIELHQLVANILYFTLGHSGPAWVLF